MAQFAMWSDGECKMQRFRAAEKRSNSVRIGTSSFTLAGILSCQAFKSWFEVSFVVCNDRSPTLWHQDTKYRWF